MIRRRDIVELQQAIADLPSHVSRGDVARAIATVIGRGNPKFRHEDFIKAAAGQTIKPAPAIPSPFDAALEERLNRIMEED